MTGRLLSAKIMLNLAIPKPHAKVPYFLSQLHDIFNDDRDYFPLLDQAKILMISSLFHKVLRRNRHVFTL